MKTAAGPSAASGGLATVLLLADGRFPAGGHAHSGGLEAAAAAGRVRDTSSLWAFLVGRAHTAGVVTAAFAASACLAFDRAESLLELDGELEARIPSPALRAVSRKLGRQLLRSLRAVHPHPALDALALLFPEGSHRPLVLGAGSRVLGLDARAAATVALHEAVTGPATAATRLLGLDPLAVHALLVELSPHLDSLARSAIGYVSGPATDLPALGAPMLDISAQHHSSWEVRLFAS